ncbi:MAG TPA: hypothetical protein VN680_06880 [Burkholderiaceae bacterium]|jgi:hypothetical protein|nr:hypothetical protein [Burkholderiaceae bacterium]
MLHLNEEGVMAQAHAHLGFSPRGVGLLYAMLWLEHEKDILGWFIGDRDGEPVAAYFVLQDYYEAGSPRFLRTLQDNVFGAWVEATPSGDAPRPQPSAISERIGHELQQLQQQFCRHWLFFGDDAGVSAEAAALAARELAVRRVNIRSSRLDKFHHGAAVWRYDAPGTDLHVLERLSRLWPLDYRVEA